MNTSLDVIKFLAAPFLISLILVGIHCYLGLHVLKRGVIFVDLSLAQVAALGASLALLFEFEQHPVLAYFMSLGCTLIASSLFAYARTHESKVPQEALIGIIYAFASAATVLISDRLAHGAEHIKNILIGQLLWVTWSDVIKTAIIYALVSLVFWIYHERFYESSAGRLSKKQSFWWDFLFYALFGVIITSSVSLVGVLQVFSYLIVPAVLGSALFTTVKARLLFGWIFGSILSFAALWLSYLYDLPTGAVIVVSFTICPVVFLFSLFLRKRPI